MRLARRRSLRIRLVRALAILSLAATAAAPAVRSAAREPLPTGPAWPEGIGPPPSPIRPREAERPGSAERDAAAAAQYAAGAAGRLLGTPADCPHDYDALHYDVTLAVDHGARTISGTTIVRFRSETASLAEVALSLKALSVSSVLRGSTPLSFTHANDTLRVTLDTPVALGDTAEIAVEYGGDPFNEGFGGFYTVDVPSTDFNLGVGITSNPPSLGRAWFPCFDSPCDKATADFHIESNLQKRGVANGAFLGVDVDSTAGTRLWHWRESHQIATYLMAASIARYDSVLVDSLYPWIEYYVHNGFFAQAPGTFANVKHMMTAFLSLFGSYPWDRFSYVTTNVGDMEHQTCVFHATSLVTGTTAYDDILSHEMGHQWWGDLVTYADWREIWLSEGFATYCEALFREQFYGAANFHAYVTASLFQPYLAQQATLTYPIYDPVSKWGTISYEKGGSVLHMLRHVMGDSLFFAGLAAYRAAHAEDVATTEDFRAACESVYGGSLDWFFQEWIYSGGHPEYTWGWYATPNGPNTDVQIRVRQTQTVGPTFTMPIDFEIQTTAGDTIVVGLVDAAFEVLDFTVPGSVTDVVFDPDDWVLDEHTLGPTGVAAGEEDARGAAGAVQVALLPASPNPAPGGGTTLAFRLPDARAATLAVFAADGRLVRTLASSRVFGPGEHRFAWDGRDERGARVASGAYLYRLDAGATRLTRRLTLVR